MLLETVPNRYGRLPEKRELAFFILKDLGERDGSMMSTFSCPLYCLELKI